MRRLLLAAVLVLVAFAGSAGAGDYSPPPGDCCAQWVTSDELLCDCASSTGWTLVPLDGRPPVTLSLPGMTIGSPVLGAGFDSPVLAAGSVPLLAAAVTGRWKRDACCLRT